MVDYFESAGHRCVFACDVHPLRGDITKLAATELKFIECDLFITNPPWLWTMLEPIVMHLSDQKPTWMLLAADLMHNVRSATIMDRCVKVVPVGRLKWIPGSKNGGMDNAAWYSFDRTHRGGPRFTPRWREHENRTNTAGHSPERERGAIARPPGAAFKIHRD